MGAVLAVVAIAGVTVFAASRTGGASGERRVERRTATAPSFTGTIWRLSSVESDGRVQRVDEGVDATVQFDPTGQFLGADGVNALSGQWHLDEGRLTVDAATTLVAYGGHDAGVLAAMAGLGSLAVGENGDSVAVGRDGPDLILRSDTHRLTFVSAGPGRPLPTAPPSSTRTP